MRLLQRLRVAQSTIAGAGAGLFVAKGKAARPFTAGQRIALYTGDWVRLEPGRNQGGPYYLQLTRSLAVDAARTDTALGRWAKAPNGAVGPGESPIRPNAELVADRGNKQGSLRALRGIQPGDEILVSYGAAYWRYHGASAANAIISLAALLRQ